MKVGKCNHEYLCTAYVYFGYQKSKVGPYILHIKCPTFIFQNPLSKFSKTMINYIKANAGHNYTSRIVLQKCISVPKFYKWKKYWMHYSSSIAPLPHLLCVGLRRIQPPCWYSRGELFPPHTNPWVTRGRPWCVWCTKAGTPWTPSGLDTGICLHLSQAWNTQGVWDLCVLWGDY